MGTTIDRLLDDGWDLVEPTVLDGEPRDLELTSGEQLQVLSDGFRLRLLTAISRRPGSAKQLADRLGIPTTRLYHHLDLLEEHGFIEVVATRRSGARTERCYGAPPWRAIGPSASLVEGEDRRELGAALRAIAEIVGVSLDEAARAGALEIPELGVEDAPVRDVVSWSSMRLTREEQERFAAELGDVVSRLVQTAAAHDEVDDDEGAETTRVTAFVVLAPDVLALE